MRHLYIDVASAAMLACLLPRGASVPAVAASRIWISIVDISVQMAVRMKQLSIQWMSGINTMLYVGE